MNSVLDSSALLALVLAEPGAAKVLARIEAGAAISTVNLAETVGYFARRGRPEHHIRSILAPLPLGVVPFDERLAYDAGLLLPLTRAAGLSLGDRACLALARRLGVPAVTADRQWQTIGASTGTTIDLIR